MMWCFRSSLHGGLSAEVLTILNGSKLGATLKGAKIGAESNFFFGDEFFPQALGMSRTEMQRRSTRF